MYYLIGLHCTHEAIQSDCRKRHKTHVSFDVCWEWKIGYYMYHRCTWEYNTFYFDISKGSITIMFPLAPSKWSVHEYYNSVGDNWMSIHHGRTSTMHDHPEIVV